MATDPRRLMVSSMQFSVADRVRVLNDISDSIRNRTTTPSHHSGTEFYNHFSRRIRSLPRERVKEGSEIILDAMGVGKRIQDIKEYAPEVTFYAEDIAKSMFKSIKDGTFNPNNMNIDRLDLGVGVQANESGESSFNWSSVQNFFSSVADVTNSLTDFVNTVNTSLNSIGCVPTYHAQKLLDQGIKYKFLFVVEFHWQPPFESFKSDLAFVVKDSTRPNITAEYEDVNMYNFRTQVPKRTSYEPMTMRFYDDGSNHAMKMWDAYQKALIPLSNLGDSPPDETTSMKFQTGGAYSAGVNAYAATYAPPPDGSTKDILSKINLFHVYDGGQKMNAYTFHNPRINNFVLDNVDMTDGSNSTEVEVGFFYDSLSVVTEMGISNIGSVESGGMSAGSGGNGSSVDTGSGFSTATNVLGSIGGFAGAIGGLGNAIGAIGGAYGAITGNKNPFAKFSGKITGIADSVQGATNQVGSIVNAGQRTVNTLKTIGRDGSRAVQGIRTAATKTATSVQKILNI